jgi:hypothetical protein
VDELLARMTAEAHGVQQAYDEELAFIDKAFAEVCGRLPTRRTSSNN